MTRTTNFFDSSILLVVPSFFLNLL